MKLKNDCSWKKSCDKKPRQHIKKRRHYFANKVPSSRSFSSCHVWMWDFYYKENWVLNNWCFWTMVFKKTLELWCSRRLLRVPWTAKRSTQSILKEINSNVHWKNWWWSWNSNTLATWCEELTHWKRPGCWERLKAGREGDDRGWDGWMASLTQWTWVWASFGSWWWTGKPGVLPSMVLQKVRHEWMTELNWMPWEHYCELHTGGFNHGICILIPLDSGSTDSITYD